MQYLFYIHDSHTGERNDCLNMSDTQGPGIVYSVESQSNYFSYTVYDFMLKFIILRIMNIFFWNY